MKSLHSLLFCGVLLLHASCSGIKTSDEKSLDDCPLVATWKQAGTDSIVVLDVGLIKDTMQIRLSQLVDDLEIIKLETRDTALVMQECRGIKCVFVTLIIFYAFVLHLF